MLLQFAYEYYALALAIPPRVIVAQESECGRGLAALLSRAAGQPRRGARRRARRQAQAGRAGDAATPASPSTRTAAATSRRAGAGATRWPSSRQRLDLPALPARIECYDISNLGETYAVASMVVFEGGAPARGHYRTFTMRYDGGPDDFARMEEALRRRFSRLAEPGEDDVSFAARPGLVVIDGGKGQLGRGAGGHARGRASTDVPVVSLAKRREEVFRPGAPSRCCWTRARPGCGCSSTCATRPTASRYATTAAAGDGG